MDGLKARLSFDAVAYDYDDEYLTIDTDTHIININNLSRLFGVQYDGNSKLIKFRISNKLSDIQKMQDSIVYINWIDSKGVKGQSIAIDKTINNDTCEFAWKVPFDALKNSGVLHFAMSAVMTENGSSVIDQRWSTQIASVITPDGIYIKSYTPSSEEEDRIAQIYNELAKMINKQNDNLQAQVYSLKEDLCDESTRAKAEEQRIEKLFTDPIQESVNTWLDEHPEATTTVQDKSITEKKIDDTFLKYIKNDYATPEMFGAVGDGVTDDTDAFKQAIEKIGYVKCNPKATYYFKSIVDVSALNHFVLDLCGCRLKNFHIKVNIADDGYKALSTWPIYPAVIMNGTIGGSFYTPDDDWKIPAIQTGTLIRLENITCMCTPYLVAFTNNYRDNCIFRNVVNASSYSFEKDELTLDAISGIIGLNKFAKISSDEFGGVSYNDLPFAGDGWIIEQCNEWHFANNDDYNFHYALRNTNLSIISCVQTKFTFGLNSNATLINCHFELESVQPKMAYKSSNIVFLTCYFYQNHILLDYSSVIYEGCYFRVAHDSEDTKYTLANFTGGKFIWELLCRLVNCRFGNYVVINTDTIIAKKNAPKKTYHYWLIQGDYEKITDILADEDAFGQFNSLGEYDYNVRIFATMSENVALQKFEKVVNIDKNNMCVHLKPDSLWKLGGGCHVDMYRTHNGTIEKTSCWFDQNIKYNNSYSNCPLRCKDYGTFALFEYSDLLSTREIEPWVVVDSIPDVVINDKMLEANGIIITTDDSVVPRLPSGYLQIKKDSLIQ